MANLPDTGYRMEPDGMNYPAAGYRMEPDSGQLRRNIFFEEILMKLIKLKDITLSANCGHKKSNIFLFLIYTKRNNYRPIKYIQVYLQFLCFEV